MAELFKDYGAHIVAVIAFAQVWVIALWKRYLQKGRVEVHPAASIEIGFGNFGPSVSLIGTVRAMARDVFVDEMKVRVIRLKDKAEHSFTWRLFRSNSISLSTNLPQTVEIASSFLLTPDSPRQYNAFFASPSFTTEYAARVQPLRDAWRQYIQEINEDLRSQISTVLQDPNLSGTFFEGFVREPLPSQIWTSLSNDFYWRAGSYELELSVNCANPTPDLNRRWHFTLTDKEEEALRLNIVVLIRELCFLPPIYNFVYKEYQAT